ncbi:hypothetical protein VPH35_101250 [Triticum aestivum]
MAAEGSSVRMAGAEGSKVAEMGPESSHGGWGPSYEFAFDAESFSDRVLRLEIVAAAAASEDVAGGSLPDGEDPRMEEVLRVKTIFINSAIIAARSPFFLKLFSNGMKEFVQTHTTVRVVDSDEHAFMELLGFIYSGKLTSTEPTLLLDILMAADKFEVVSCMRHCCHLLTSLPLTTKSALLYLDHPCSTLMAAEVQRLIVAAKEFLCHKYKDFTKFQHELMNFPLVGIEAIFSSTNLQVLIEDEIYTFMLKWARARYPELDERRTILSSRLLPLVRFSHMSFAVLREVLTCTDDDIDHDQVNKCIAEILLHKAYPAHAHGDLSVDTATCRQFEERTYMYKPLRLVAFDGPHPQVITYWDLKREECSQFFSSERNHRPGIISHLLHHAGLDLFLVAQCYRNHVSELCTFGLSLYIRQSSRRARVTLEYEFAAKTKALRKFVSRFQVKARGSKLGCGDFFGTPWSTFIANDNLFIDGVLHLRADWTVLEQSEL